MKKSLSCILISVILFSITMLVNGCSGIYDGKELFFTVGCSQCHTFNGVITSYSIHYTKLYEVEIAPLSFVLKDKQVNRFMTDSYSILFSKPAADLLGAPVISEKRHDQGPGFGRDPRFGGFRSPVFRKTVRLFRTLSTKPTVTTHLPTDCRFMDTDNPGDCGRNNFV